MYKTIEIPKLNKGYYCCYSIKLVYHKPLYLYRIQALLNPRCSPVPRSANLHLPCFLPLSVHRSPLSEVKKGTDTFRILNLLGKAPKQADTRVPSWSFPVLLKHWGLCPEQHPGIKGTSLSRWGLSPCWIGRWSHLCSLQSRDVDVPMGQCLRAWHLQRVHASIALRGLHSKRGGRKWTNTQENAWFVTWY